MAAPRRRVGPGLRQRVLEPLAVVVGLLLGGVVARERLGLGEPVVVAGERLDVHDRGLVASRTRQRPAGVVSTSTSWRLPSRAR